MGRYMARDALAARKGLRGMQAWRLGSYELIRQLGEGGMATVYLARDVRLGREVAVKVLDQRLAERPGFRERFLREARVAAALDHPNIVSLYDFSETDQILYLVMPYVSGGSLQDLLRRAPLPTGEVVTYGSQMADALDYAHQRNVVHRDVKPANMLLHADGRLMLSDFGLAKIVSAGSRPIASRGHPDAGTPEYMAPEQIEGRTDERADIYGLGVVLYLLLTGHLPFRGQTSNAVMEGHLYRLPEEPRTLNPAITPAMQTVILQALAKRPEERFQRAGDLGAALLGALVAGDAEPLPFTLGSAEPPASLPPLTTPRTTGRPQSRNWNTPRISTYGPSLRSQAAANMVYGHSEHSEHTSSMASASAISRHRGAPSSPVGPINTMGRMPALPRVEPKMPMPASYPQQEPGFPDYQSVAAMPRAISEPPQLTPFPQTPTPVPMPGARTGDLLDEDPQPLLRWWVLVAVLLMLALLAAGILLRWLQDHPTQPLPTGVIPVVAVARWSAPYDYPCRSISSRADAMS